MRAGSARFSCCNAMRIRTRISARCFLAVRLFSFEVPPIDTAPLANPGTEAPVPNRIPPVRDAVGFDLSSLEPDNVNHHRI